MSVGSDAGGSRTGRSALPQVDAVLRAPGADAVAARHGRARLRDAVRADLAELRAALGDADGATDPATDAEADAAAVLARAAARLDAAATAGLRPVINATGVVLHTNLGRAPLSEAARRAVSDAAGYSTVEFDLATGGRGSRTRHAADLAARLAGSEAAHVVNNGAGALLLAVAGLAAGREVIVSRGELVEIGGSFRLPDVIAASGARLVEVGTTNRTRAADYAAALGPDTGLILKVHRSNFRLVGFTEEADLAELVALGRAHGAPTVLDAGSGLMDPSELPALGQEPAVRRAVADGADLVVLSGDKLLGGPQAGILVGRAGAIERCRRHPLSRALRIDKLQVAALEPTLEAHLRDGGTSELPAVAMLAAPLADLEARAAGLARTLRAGPAAVDVEVVTLDGAVGAGAAADLPLPSAGVAIRTAGPSRLLARLRAGTPPVVGRIVDDHVVLDLRTVPEDADAALAALVAAAVRDPAVADPA